MASIYHFKVEDAERFAIEQGIKYRKFNNEIALEVCPYCGGKTKVDRKRFSINARTGQFKCLRASCGAKGNMLTLAKDFDFSLGSEADTYYGLGPKRKYRTFTKMVRQDPTEAIDYMSKRGISEDVLRKYDITVVDDLIVFPFLDEKGDLIFTKYRVQHPKEGQGKEFCEENCKPILFGMYQCNLESKTLIITEGQIDSLSVAEAGIENAVSVPTGANGFTWVPHCWNWLENFEKIIVFGDHEHDRITLYNELCARLKYKVWHVRESDYKDCKDANEILLKYGAEQIRECINNAEQTPISKVKNLSEVENVNPFLLAKLPTGIKDVDDLLCGGLPFGQVILLTGKAGDGKSTLASQILLSAIENGHPCFAYSGELPNYLFKSWIDFQAAGPNNSVEMWTKWGNPKERPREIKENALRKINKWYDGKIWIYDNTDVMEGPEETLSEIIEQAVNQYGIKVVLIDNLMTAMDLEKVTGSDKYDKQSAFVKQMARLALQHQILIILVAHKRKDYGNSEVNEMVSGSLDIVNLAGIVLSYERPTDKLIKNLFATKQDRILKITKNRVFGKIDKEGFVLKYDPKSKRIYITDAEKDKVYSWDKEDEEDEAEDLLPWEVDNV